MKVLHGVEKVSHVLPKMAVNGRKNEDDLNGLSKASLAQLKRADHKQHPRNEKPWRNQMVECSLCHNRH